MREVDDDGGVREGRSRGGFVTLVMGRDSSLAWLWELPEMPGVSAAASLPCHDARDSLHISIKWWR